MSTTTSPATAAPAAQPPPAQEWAQLRPPVRDTDFKEKYPPDRDLGSELDDAARVWKVYRGEAIEHDDALLKTWNDTVNILLTFAGLFSAAVTSFVVASTDDLKPDPNAYIANLLFAMLNDASGNSTNSPLAHLPAPPSLDATPTQLSRLVNGLWFISLFLSLAAALLCILVKQWLDEYTSRTRSSSKNPRHWAQRRAFYFQGLSDWNVPAIISFLPLFLHLALFLFLAGLTAFLWDLDNVIRWVLLCLVVLLLLFYAASYVISGWNAACPYATPLLVQLRNLRFAALIWLCSLRVHLLRVTHPHLPPSPQGTFADEQTRRAIMNLESGAKILRDQKSRRPFDGVLQKAKEKEQYTPDDGRFASSLDCNALSWLIHDVSDSDAVAVAWQSLGALLGESNSLRAKFITTVARSTVNTSSGASIWQFIRSGGLLDDLQLGRITRSLLWLTESVEVNISWVWFTLATPERYSLETTRLPDAALIFAYSADGPVNTRTISLIHGQRGHTPLPSTALALIRRQPAGRSDQVLSLLYFCQHNAIPPDVWQHIARVLEPACPSIDTQNSHTCDRICVVNVLAQRVLWINQEENSRRPNGKQWSFTGFDGFFHVWLMTYILSSIDPYASRRQSLARLHPSVWGVVTDARYWSSIPTSNVGPGTRSRADQWALALARMADGRDPELYVTSLPAYILTWNQLLRGCVRSHLPVAESEGEAGAFSVEESLHALDILMENDVLTWTLVWAAGMEPRLQVSMLHATLSVLDSLTTATGLQPRDHIATLVPNLLVPLINFVPVVLEITADDPADWIKLFARTMQHCIAREPAVWQDILQSVEDNTHNVVKVLFADVLAVLQEAGPCKEGHCAHSKESEYWLPSLGPIPSSNTSDASSSGL